MAKSGSSASNRGDSGLLNQIGGTMEERYAVIGESEGVPILYHMNQKRLIAEQLRKRREALIALPCFIVPMTAWHVDPLGALREAQGVRGDTP